MERFDDFDTTVTIEEIISEEYEDWMRFLYSQEEDS